MVDEEEIFDGTLQLLNVRCSAILSFFLSIRFSPNKSAEEGHESQKISSYSSIFFCLGFEFLWTQKWKESGEKINLEDYLTLRSPHQINGFAPGWITKLCTRLSHCLRLLNPRSSSFQPLLGTYVFSSRKVLNSAIIALPSASCAPAHKTPPKPTFMSTLWARQQVT